MAHKKGQGSSRNGRDSHAKRLGIKLADSALVLTGQIILRQRGTKWKPLPFGNVGQGKDDTLFALTDGFVKFTKKMSVKGDRTYVQVLPIPKEA